MYESEIKIPVERVPVLIGKNGQTKKRLQLRTKTKIVVSKEGEVLVASEDNMNIFNVLPIIRAIGRGFNPDIAFVLLNEEYVLEIIPLSEYAKHSKKHAVRLKARLIGREGKARVQVERMTNTRIVIYGKTVGIIGKVDDVVVAKGAVIKLLQGAPHGNTYKYIENQNKKRLAAQFA